MATRSIILATALVGLSGAAQADKAPWYVLSGEDNRCHQSPFSPREMYIGLRRGSNAASFSLKVERFPNGEPEVVTLSDYRHDIHVLFFRDEASCEGTLEELQQHGYAPDLEELR